MNNWKIIDDNSTIHSGNEYQMKRAFMFMTNDMETLKLLLPDERTDIIKTNINFWESDWEGDLELVQIHEAYR